MKSLTAATLIMLCSSALALNAIFSDQTCEVEDGYTYVSAACAAFVIGISTTATNDSRST